jgi:FkbM family methyltransferase
MIIPRIQVAVRWLSLWLQYVALGWALRRVAADRRSRLVLLYLGATTLLRSRAGRKPRPVNPRICLGTGVYRVGLQTRTELDVLYEIGIEDEYGAADDIAAETILDLGASVGLATLRLLSSHPGARVVAVEADPVLIPRLRENVAGLPVTVIHAAVSAASGERRFYRSEMDSWASSLDRTRQNQTSLLVPALSLGDLLDQAGLERVDLLKLDVEGAEWEIFETPDVFSRFAAVIGEVHRREGRDPERFIDDLGREMKVRKLSAQASQATFLATSRDGEAA